MAVSGALMVKPRSRNPFPQDTLSLKVGFWFALHALAVQQWIAGGASALCRDIPPLQDRDTCRWSGKQLNEKIRVMPISSTIAKQEQPNSRRIRGSSAYVFTGSFSQPQQSGQEEAQNV